MILSYVIVTHNRRAALLETLGHLRRETPLPADAWEAWVVDNASTDGTIEAVRERFPEVRVMARSSNDGACVRTEAFEHAAGEFIVTLDDDSYPIGDAVSKSIDHLRAEPDCAAVVGRCLLPDGGQEACAMPGVFLSGAACFRRRVLIELGGFRKEFFRKAGEYDLSFRMWQAGYRVERRDDVVYRHDKVATGRSSDLAHRMDLRNNLILAERFLPAPWRRVYRADWLKRYAAIGLAAGHGEAVAWAIAEARQWAGREREAGRAVLGAVAREALFQWQQTETGVVAWARDTGVASVVIADFAKNIYAVYRAARRAGLTVLAVADDRSAFAGRRYRGVPILKPEAAWGLRPDGVVLANMNPAQQPGWRRRIEAVFEGPVFGPETQPAQATPAAIGGGV